MRIDRRIWSQLAVLIAISTTAFAIMALGYMQLPVLLFGVGHYQITVELPEAAGLYERANVTYLGTRVGQVNSIELTPSGVSAVLSLRSDIAVPSDLDAEVHSVSAVGEQYVALLPRKGHSAPLKNGDVIPASRTSVPPDINSLLDATNTGLRAIPGDNLKTVIDESYLAFGGLGPEIARIVDGSSRLAIDARANLEDLTNVVDNVGPMLDTQTDTGDSVQAWASHLATITQQLKDNDKSVEGLLQNGPAAAEEVRQLFERLNPTLSVVLANLASIAPVVATYNPSLEQILVLLPRGVQVLQGSTVANQNIKQPYHLGSYLSFNFNINLPPPCLTGYLPVAQMRSPSLTDAPDRPPGDMYCRIPQDAMFNVRGARNLPCVTRPGKRAPTVKMCESDENYMPLNDGYNWKGDPNATVSGQDVPQREPGVPAATPRAAADASVAVGQLPPISVAEYDPATGTYTGPDGQRYSQSNLAQPRKEQTWQSMFLPPTTP
ncbi:MCE family protein [Mycolicibacterium holsaticum]|uniref:Mammalian cell entry protein n=1 Tax=Mycolicibacterium holsaticum TaxID=152142 RepID=A0A1E3S2H5_9MYCO|nr:MlaD family protein [Mycolicibacterium holsaticum]ODQ96373.1 mammalian cell entry protein [Mycolicibacterium holsaticum]